MADLPSRLDYFQIGRDFVVQRAKKIDPAQVDVAGSDVNIVVGMGSVLCDAVTKQLGYRTAALLLDGCEKEDLDRYAYDRYQLTRKGASAAVVPVQLSRASFAKGAGDVPVGTVLRADSGVQYVLTSPTSFGATDLSAPLAYARAVQAGKATQVAAGQLRAFSQPGTLFDSSLEVNNLVDAAGGEDAESDDLFKGRIRDFWRTARRGTLGAIAFGALSVPGVVSANAVEALGEGGLPARVVNLYIADSSGVANAALAALVATALDDYRAGGIAVLISTSLPTIVGVQLRLAFRPNVDTVALTANVRAAVVQLINSLPVNGSLLVAQIYTVLQRFAEDGLIPLRESIVAPAGDVVPAVGQTLRTNLANVVAL